MGPGRRARADRLTTTRLSCPKLSASADPATNSVGFLARDLLKTQEEVPLILAILVAALWAPEPAAACSCFFSEETWALRVLEITASDPEADIEAMGARLADLEVSGSRLHNGDESFGDLLACQ